MTSITELATDTIDRTSALGWDQGTGAAAAARKPASLPQASIDLLLKLDGLGWGRFFAEHNVDHQMVRQLERLAAAWRSQSDHRTLRKIASARKHEPAGKATQAIIEEWVTYADCERLGYLVLDMGFAEPEVPVCYALCSAIRAIHSAVDYASDKRNLTGEEINAARAELLDSAEEYSELSGLGILEEPPE